MATNWPLGPADLRKALTLTPAQEDDEELALFIQPACEIIDRKTGRNLEPHRHETDGKVPSIFIIAARETAKLWWQQTKNGPRNRPQQGETIGPPAGADLPSKVKSWLADYPPRLYIPDTP